MSSLDLAFLSPLARGAARIAVMALVGFGLTACFRPLYGPTASGASMADVLASIDVAPVTASIGQERITHYLRSELVFDLDGSGEPHAKNYKLTVLVTEQLSTPIVDAVSGRADSATLTANAAYTLTSRDGTRVIITDRATASATYDRFTQRFASVRAARDAEIRIAKLLSDQIKTRLAAALATAA